MNRFEYFKRRAHTVPREENRKNRHQAIVRTDVWYHSTVESRFNGLQGTGEKSILTVVRLMWDSTKWARFMDFDRQTYSLIRLSVSGK